MLSIFVRLVRTTWTLAVVFLSKLWSQLLHFGGLTGINTSEINTPEMNEPEARTLGFNAQEFPPTEDQDAQVKTAFIESLDPDAVCALASRHNNGKPCRVVSRVNGNFNICFFVKFSQDGPEWIVRVLIESILDNPWDKLLSEVTTIE